MCGIGAIIDFSEHACKARVADQLQAIDTAQAHRGPDGKRTVVNAVGQRLVGLAFQRLAILDLADAAMQPMHSACGRYSLVFNGEIYNYRELRDLVRGNPLVHSSSGDSAVLLALLEREGEQALARLIGMWALVLVDHHERRVLVARDRVGVKPLYWYQNRREGVHQLLFCSEVKGIFAATGARFALNPQAVARYFLQSVTYDTQESFFQGIARVPPAHYAWMDLRKPGVAPRFVPYWSHPYTAGYALPAPRPAQLRDALIEAVRLRLRSDVPIGMLLSGGLDSSVIVQCAKDLNALDQLHIISAISSDPESNEEPFIDRISAHIGVSPHKVKIDANPMEILQELPEVLWHNEVPLSSLSMWAFGKLMARAKELGVTVLLTGQGADEQLGGYKKFIGFYLADRVRRLHFGDAASFAAGLLWNRTYQGISPSEAKRFVRVLRAKAPAHLSDALLVQALASNGLGQSYEMRELSDIEQFSMPALLNYEDKLSMAFSREVRAPFLDHRVIELLAHVPVNQKLVRGWSKHILRQAFADHLPPEITWRRDKRGFNVPESKWCRTDFVPTFRSMLSDGLLLADSGLVNADAVRNLLDDYIAARNGVAYKDVLNVFLMEFFVRRFQPHLHLPSAA